MNTTTHFSSYEECRDVLKLLQGYVFNMNSRGCDPSPEELNGFDNVFSCVLHSLDAVIDRDMPQSAREVL